MHSKLSGCAEAGEVNQISYRGSKTDSPWNSMFLRWMLKRGDKINQPTENTRLYTSNPMFLNMNPKGKNPGWIYPGRARMKLTKV